MSKYIPFTTEQKERAASVDLEEFLRRRGEKLITSGRDKRLASDHSITIRGCEWFDHATEQGGRAISFVKQFYGLSYPEAVSMLLGDDLGGSYPAAKEKEPAPAKPFVLPPQSESMRRVYAYLLKKRCIDREMDADYVKENPYVYLSVKGEDMVFQITACFITDIDFDYIAPDPTGEELTNFFEQVAKKNWLEFDGVTFGEEDTVLTLSTCCRKYDEYNTGNQRLVLMAKLLPEGAVAQDFTVRLAPEPEMP